MNTEIRHILDENHRRMSRRKPLPDPLRGDSSSPLRVQATAPDPEMPSVYIPLTMPDDPCYPTALHDLNAWKRLRCRHDFEYWCATCCTIKHKTRGLDMRFRLNAPQRKVLAVLEDDA